MFACALSLPLLVTPLFAATPKETQPKPTVPQRRAALNPEAIFHLVSHSVAVVEALDPQERVIAQGSGVAVANHLLVTNRHVIVDGTSIRVRREGAAWAARLLRSDIDHDLSLLEVPDAAFPAVALRPSATVNVGERVYAVGAPEGLELTFADGLISALRAFDGLRFIQTTVPVSHGSSGGGLFDAEGRLLGITTFQFRDGQNLNFAIPSECVAAVQASGSSAIGIPAGRSHYDAMLLFQLGAAEIDRNDWDGAIRHLKEAVGLSPDLADCWYALGVASFARGEISASTEAFKEAIRLNNVSGSIADVWWALGTAYEKAERYTEALDATLEAVQRNPQSLPYLRQLGELYFKVGNYADGKEAFKRAISSAPANSDVWTDFGYDLVQARLLPEAIDALLKATELDSRNSTAWLYLGTAYQRNGDNFRAREVLENCTKLDRQNAVAWNNLAAVWAELGQLDKAIQCGREAVRIHPADTQAWYNLGSFYCNRKDEKDLRTTVARLEKLDSAKAAELMRKCVLR